MPRLFNNTNSCCLGRYGINHNPGSVLEVNLDIGTCFQSIRLNGFIGISLKYLCVTGYNDIGLVIAYNIFRFILYRNTFDRPVLTVLYLRYFTRRLKGFDIRNLEILLIFFTETL